MGKEHTLLGVFRQIVSFPHTAAGVVNEKRDAVPVPFVGTNTDVSFDDHDIAGLPLLRGIKRAGQFFRIT